MKQKKLLSIFSLFIIMLSACSPKNFSTDIGQSISPNDSLNENTYSSLSWEKSVGQSKVWSKMIFDLIATEDHQLLNVKVSDMDVFCPNYDHLNQVQKISFWGQLIVGMAKFESGWDPTNRYIETTMGNDPITGTTVASEGLLQLSYQDSKNFGSGFCDFDWSKDKPLHLKNPRDPNISILDPYRNLRCGLQILTRQIRAKKAITIDQGAYWSVIKLNSSHEKIHLISMMTRDLPFCD